MINYTDIYESQVVYYQSFCELELSLFSSTGPLSQNCVGSETCLSEFDQRTDDETKQKNIPRLKKKSTVRRRPTKKIQYQYHQKKKRPAPKPIIHVKEDGLKVCLILEKPKSSAHPFSIQEDHKILQHVLKLGPKFYKIAKNFPGKSVSMVKNRYYKYLRFRWDQVMGSQYAHLNVPFSDGSNQDFNQTMSIKNQEMNNRPVPNDQSGC